MKLRAGEGELFDLAARELPTLALARQIGISANQVHALIKAARKTNRWSRSAKAAG